ncbi:MAG: hypothetical protein ABIQ31_04285 [Ferruginibacter sp.]
MTLFRIVVFLIAITCSNCKGQVKKNAKEIYNKDFKWTIRIPENFDTVAADQWKKIQNRGAEAIEKTYDEKIENNAKTIFVFKSDQFNYFESNYQSFDVAKDGSYLENFRSVNGILFGTFQAQMPDAKWDSVSSTEIISGLTFLTFNVTITFPNKMVVDVWMYSRLFGKKEFTVNIMTVDKQKQKLLFDAWKNSKFEGK